MKYLVLVFLSAVVALSQAGLLTEEQKAKIMEIHRICFEQSNVDLGVVEKAKKGEYVDDPKLKEQILCFNKRAGFQNEAGEFQMDKIKQNLMEIVKDEKKVDELIAACVIKKDTPLESAFQATKCFHQKSPQQDLLD